MVHYQSTAKFLTDFRSICRILDLIRNSVLRRSTQLQFLSKQIPTEIERYRGFETLHGRQMLGAVSVDYT